MVVALDQHAQIQSLSRTGVRSILDIGGLVLFSSKWQTLDCFESHLIAVWHHLEITGE